ncbi:alpha/beta fold hydrolase [Streptomyces sp. ODS28]|uniref:alpha/beta fold hydrolase n=1 Tax=Streptomyces sp. ODS28 TaxID=3136688 RepID=UPI0031E98217
MTQISGRPAPAPVPPQALPYDLATTVTGSGPGILLAHGAGGGVAANFAPLVPALAAEHTVIGGDYPGSGDTPRSPEPLDLDALADSLAGAAVRAGAGTFTVLGYSLGTAVAARLAARHPERVRGLVLTAGLARADRRLRLSMGVWRDLLGRGDTAAYARFNALTAFGADHLDSLTEEELAALLPEIADTVPPGAPEQAALVQTADTTADLAGITVPTLVVATTQDTLVSPAHSRRVAELVPGAEYAELATGHLPMVEDPAGWQSLITDFLRRHGL